MSGHSKWSTIKRQKGVADAKRSAIFSKLSKQIAVAARAGTNPESNLKLKLAIDRAKQMNLPNDNIDRAIRAGSGADKGQHAAELMYEGFGPGHVAVMVQAISDNPNRTNADIRNLFSRHGGTLGSIGSVGWMFQSRGVLRVPLDGLNKRPDEVELDLIDTGAEEVRTEGPDLVVECQPMNLAAMKQALQLQGATMVNAEIEFVPISPVSISEADRQRLYQFFDALEDHPDVTEIFNNAE